MFAAATLGLVGAAFTWLVRAVVREIREDGLYGEG
jgi:hypothetical protein